MRELAINNTRGKARQMALDLIIRNARLASAGPDHPTVDIGVRNGIILAVEPHLAADGPEHDAGGKLVSPGLIESHFHLDKAMIIDRVPIQPHPSAFSPLSVSVKAPPRVPEGCNRPRRLHQSAPCKRQAQACVFAALRGVRCGRRTACLAVYRALPSRWRAGAAGRAPSGDTGEVRGGAGGLA
jgi:hypothetical protein